MRSNCGVVVDGLRAKSVGTVPSRYGFYPAVKFVAAHGKPLREYPPVPPDEAAGDHNQRGTFEAMRRSVGAEIYPGVDLERSLFLTHDYLCDFYRLASDRPRDYHWQVQAIGWPKPDDPAAWQPGDEINAKLFNPEGMFESMAKTFAAEPQRYLLKDLRKRDVMKNSWSLDLVQTWSRPAYGVRVRMLGEQGTRLYTGHVNDDEPAARRGAEEERYQHTTLIVARNAPATLFAALHEPTKNRQSKVAAFERIQETAKAIGVAIHGRPQSGIDDRVLYRFFGAAAGPATLSDGQESFTFADHAWVRIALERIEVWGDLWSMRIRVAGKPRLFVGGSEVRARIDRGVLTFSKEAKAP